MKQSQRVYGTSCGSSIVQMQHVSRHYRPTLWQLYVAILAPVFYSSITSQSLLYDAYSVVILVLITCTSEHDQHVLFFHAGTS